MKSLHAFALLLLSAAAAAAQTNTFPASGNVGIGTTSPNGKLCVADANAIVRLGAYGGDVVGTIYVDIYNDGTKTLFDNYKSGVGYLPLILNGSGGNVGIGTNNPLSKLNIQADNVGVWDGGQILVSGTANPNKRLSLGFDTTNNIGFIQSLIAGDNYYALALNPHGGNVGIGTTSPSGKIQIKYDSSVVDPLFFEDVHSGYERIWRIGHGVGASTGFGFYDQNVGLVPFFIQDSSGNVGIGTTNPLGKLFVNLGVDMNWSMTTGTNGVFTALRAMSNGANSFVAAEIDASVLNINSVSGGNVGIGTTNPTEKLSVNGKIRAKEIIVETTGWSDCVFAKDYKLAPLSEVEQHIQQQGHLPGVPSATEVAENGVSVGNMQAVLLAKVEELTLHLIAQEKEVAALRAEVQHLRKNQ